MRKAPLKEHIASYLRLQQQTLGKSFADEAKVLRSFERYVASHAHLGPVTQELAIAFATDDGKRSPERSWKRYNIVRHFAQYLAVFVPGTSALDPRALRRHYKRPPPFILTDEELARLFNEARNPRKSQIAAATHYTVFGLAVSTGMRVGEVSSLDLDDVDLKAAQIKVRDTKFRKDRLVPVHATTVTALRDYVATRDAAFPTRTTDAFFVSTTRRERYYEDSLTLAFTAIAQQGGLRRPDGREPTFHSLRHTFAVRRLTEWYREGVDVQAMLPVLATYMGHVNYTSTAYYLTATPELLALAAERHVRYIEEVHDA
jgi:integrase